MTSKVYEVARQQSREPDTFEQMPIADAKDLLEMYRLNLKDIDRELKWLDVCRESDAIRLRSKGRSPDYIRNHVEKLDIEIAQKKISRRIFLRMIKKHEGQLRRRLAKKK